MGRFRLDGGLTPFLPSGFLFRRTADLDILVLFRVHSLLPSLQRFIQHRRQHFLATFVAHGHGLLYRSAPRVPRHVRAAKRIVGVTLRACCITSAFYAVSLVLPCLRGFAWRVPVLPVRRNAVRRCYHPATALPLSLFARDSAAPARMDAPFGTKTRAHAALLGCPGRHHCIILCAFRRPCWRSLPV